MKVAGTRCWRQTVFLLGLILVGFAPCWGQIGGQASLVGTVKDPSGAVLPGAEVTVSGQSTGVVRRAVTNESGNYSVERLQPGEYSVAAELSGFKRSVVRGVVLQVADRARVDITLPLGEVSDEVFVEGAGRPIIQTENATLAEVVGEEQVRELPLNGRNFLQLATLTPGVVDSNNGIIANASGSVSVNGYGDLGNNFLLDGTSNSADGIAGRMNFAPSLELVKEFRVQSSIYSAEYGRSGGAQINIVSKRGERQYHGSLFYFHRNDNTEARNFFQTGEIPEFRRNDFGASIGGPVIPGKSDPRNFFFFAWESRREGRGLTRSSNVPPLAFRQGDFSGIPEVVYDPLTLDPATGLRQPFPDNRIPADRISPQAAFFLQFYPNPQLPGRFGNYIANPTRTWNTDQFSIRYDGDYSDRDSLFARFTTNDSKQLEPLGVVPVATPFPGFGEIVNFKGKNFQVSWTHTFSPTAINSFSFGLSSFDSLRSNEQTGRNFAEEAGIQGIQEASANQGSPWIVLSGWQSIGDDPFNPQIAPQDNWEWADTVTQIHQNHSVKYGVNVIRNVLDLDFHAVDRGAIFFNPVYTTSGTSQPGNEINAFADFLLGLPASSTRRTAPIVQYLSQYWFMLFLQDDWQIHRDVTLNLGMRYEIWRRPIERDNRLSELDIFRFNSPTFVVAGSPEAEAVGLPRSFDGTDKNDFGPRFGFAWRIGGNDRWVLRGGYGLFYQWIVLDKQNNLGIGPPFIGNISLTNDPDVPRFTFQSPFDAPALPSVSGNSIPLNNRSPYNQQYSLTLSHEFSSSLGLEVGYVGSAARKNQFSLDLNQPAPGPGGAAGRRPYPAFAGISAYANWGTSHYDSLQATLRKDAGSDGLSILASYTWSKALAAGREGGVFHFGNPIRSVRDWKADSGPTSFDVRHRLAISYLYELPFGRGKAVGSDVSPVVNQIVGGWKIGGITAFQGGNRLTPSSIFNFSNSGGSRPNLAGDPNSGPRTIGQWFNTAAFVDAQQFTFGTSGVGVIEGPGFAVFDLSFYKDFAITDDKRLQFRAELFNAFNRANFGNPNTSYGASQFGSISSARDARQIQFGLRFDF